MRTLCEAFQESAARDPDAVALRAYGSAATVTWREYARGVRRVAEGLHAIGVKHGDAVALMMFNRPEFHIVDTAAIHLGAVPFSMYNTSSPSQVAYLLENSNARVAVVDAAHADRLAGCAIPVIRIDGLLDDLPADPEFDFDETWRQVTPDDLATIIYTSGTSGPPKGVEITHANVLAQAAAIASVYDLHMGDIGMSYLPAAHIADRLASHYLQMLYAADITCVADLDDLGAALADVRPTYWMSVPRVFEKMRVRIEQSVEQAPRLKRWMWLAARAYPHGIADPLVFRKVRARIGLDRARFVLSGAAPLSVPVLEFFRDLGIPLCEIWGMSETCGVGTANPPGRVRPGTVGVPLPGVEVQLADDGELLIRGPIVARGYRNDPQRTAEAFDADGWLHSGDVARYDDQGYLKIVDRKKELIINSSGKNMSPSRIEAALVAASPLLANVVVVGDGRAYNVALIVLDPSVAERTEDIDQALEDGIVAGNAELSRVEQVKRYAVVDGPWEPGGDELTPTMKLRRETILAKYAETINGLYRD